MNAIYIMWLRQLKRYFRSKARIVGSIGQPLLFLVALGFGFGATFEKAGEGNYIQFLTPGIVTMSILFTALFSGIEIIWDRQFGFLKETLVAPVSRFEIVIGKTLGGATVAVFQGIVVALVATIVGFRPENYPILPLAVLFMFLIAILFAALGTAIASLLEDMQGFQLIMNFLVMPLFFLSGAIFPLQDSPGFIRFIAAINPLSYGVDALRGIFTGVTNYGYGTDLLVLGGLTLLVWSVGSYLFSRIEV